VGSRRPGRRPGGEVAGAAEHRSVPVGSVARRHQDEKSRRTLAIPQNAVTALREHRKWQTQARLAAGPLWQDTGLVFTTSVGTPAVEEIARLAGHAISRTTETIYRHELRPVITTGADVMDKLFMQPPSGHADEC
jgi:hypothetical protein